MALTTILLENNDITKNTIIGGNVDIDRYIPAIKAFQKTVLKPLLSEPLYNKICADFKNNTLSGLYLELYDDYLKDMVIHGSAEIYLKFAAFQVSNSSITKLKAKVDDTETINESENAYIVEASRQLYQSYERDFLKWIKINGENIPEYPINTQQTNNSNRITVGGWLLYRKNC